MRVTKLFLFLVLSTYLFANDTSSSSLTPNYTFLNLNINYFDWMDKAERDSGKGDFSYVGVEGGAGWDSVEAYGFLNIENPLNPYDEEAPDDLRFSAFGDVDVKIHNNFKLHFQNYALNSDTFYVNDFVVGVGYKFTTDFGLWFRPFVGLHHTYSTYYTGLNGYMGGWLFNYDFKLFGKKCTIFQWHEMEFARQKEFYLDDDGNPTGDGKSWGIIGALSGWLYFTPSVAAGVQYRYAHNKLGYANYQSGVIYTLKYYF